VVFAYNTEEEYKGIENFVKKFDPKDIPICVTLGPLSKDGVKNFKTFSEAKAHCTKELARHQDEIIKTFFKFDKDQSGNIDAVELMEFSKHIGLTLTKEECA
jgi:hypothetical protein